MSCEEWREDVSAWADGELSSKRWIAVDAHIKSCRDCRRLAREFRQLTTIARRVPAPHASSRLTSAALALVHERAGNEPRGRSWSWWPLLPRMFWPQFTLAASGLALAAFLSLVVFRSGFAPFLFGTDKIASLPTPVPSSRNGPTDVAIAVPSPDAAAHSIAGTLTVQNSAAGTEQLISLARELGGTVNAVGAPYQSTVYVSIPTHVRDMFRVRLSEIGSWQNSTAPTGADSVMGIEIIQRP